MKLSDLKNLTESKKIKAEYNQVHTFKKLDLWQDGAANLDSADVEVEYDLEPGGHDDHPYGSTTARMEYAPTATIHSVKLEHDVNEHDDEDNVIGKLKAGTDLMKQKWWKKSYTVWLSQQVINLHRG